MMNRWKIYKLSDIADVQTGPFGSQLHQRDYVDVGTPCIMPCNIGANLDVQTDNIVHLKASNIIRLNKYCVKEGDIIYSRRGDIEKCAYINHLQEGWLCGTGCLRIRPNTSICFPKYLAYLLSTKESKKWIVANAVGTTMLNLNSSILNTMPISLPPLAEQKRIADILSAIDDKIELNRRINANLEQQAQALYKSWFVDFEPFGGKMPEDWKEGTLGEICITNKRSYSGKFYNSFEYLDTGSVTSNKIDTIQLLNPTIDKIPSRARRAVTEGDILYSSVRPNQKHYMFLYNPSSNMVVSTGFIVITANWSGYRYYIYQYLIQDIVIQHLQSIAEQSVSTYPSINASDITNLEINIPSNKAIEKYANVMNPIMKQITNNQSENLRLAQLRDTLLPKLMSGEITV